MFDCQPAEGGDGTEGQKQVKDKEETERKGGRWLEREGGEHVTRLWLNVVVNLPLSLTCLGFCLVTLLVHLIWFPLKDLLLRIYSASLIPRFAYHSYLLPPPTCEISASVTGALRHSPLSRSPSGAGKTREDRWKEYNRLSLLYAGTSTLTEHLRTQAPMTFQLTTQCPQRHFFLTASSPYVLCVTHSLAFGCWVQ